MKTLTIIVLNDGETYTSADKCEILTITKKGAKLLEEGYSPKDLEEEHVVSSITLECTDLEHSK